MKGEVRSLQTILVIILALSVGVYFFYVFASLQDQQYLKDELEFESYYLTLQTLSSQADGYFVWNHKKDTNYSFDNNFLSKDDGVVFSKRAIFFEKHVGEFDYELDEGEFRLSSKAVGDSAISCIRNPFPNKINLNFNLQDSQWSKTLRESIEITLQKKGIEIVSNADTSFDFVGGEKTNLTINPLASRYMCGDYNQKNQVADFVFNVEQNDDGIYLLFTNLVEDLQIE